MKFFPLAWNCCMIMHSKATATDTHGTACTLHTVNFQTNARNYWNKKEASENTTKKKFVFCISKRHEEQDIVQLRY